MTNYYYIIGRQHGPPTRQAHPQEPRTATHPILPSHLLITPFLTAQAGGVVVVIGNSTQLLLVLLMVSFGNRYYYIWTVRWPIYEISPQFLRGPN